MLKIIVKDVDVKKIKIFVGINNKAPIGLLMNTHYSRLIYQKINNLRKTK